MKKVMPYFIIILIICSFYLSAGADSFQNDYIAINRAANSMLELLIYTDDSDEPAFQGSGFVAFSSSLLVTNYHVIEKSQYVYAIDDKDNIHELDRIIAVDQERDIAILRFSDSTSLTPLILNTSRSYLRGQPIVAIGSPGGIKNTVSTGVISAIVEDSGTHVIQFTAAISPGSSGGALFNDDGEVVGITSSYYVDKQNMNYAIDIGYAVDLYNVTKSVFGYPLISYNWNNPEIITPPLLQRLSQWQLPSPQIRPKGGFSIHPRLL